MDFLLNPDVNFRKPDNLGILFEAYACRSEPNEVRGVSRREAVSMRTENQAGPRPYAAMNQFDQTAHRWGVENRVKSIEVDQTNSVHNAYRYLVNHEGHEGHEERIKNFILKRVSHLLNFFFVLLPVALLPAAFSAARLPLVGSCPSWFK